MSIFANDHISIDDVAA